MYLKDRAGDEQVKKSRKRGNESKQENKNKMQSIKFKGFYDTHTHGENRYCLILPLGSYGTSCVF